MKEERERLKKEAQEEEEDEDNADLKEDSNMTKRVGNALFYTGQKNTGSDLKKKMNTSQNYSIKVDQTLERIAKPKGFEDDEDRDELIRQMNEKTEKRSQNR